jgi:ribosome-binding protein aMBF1 (putative translation factor)
MMREDKKRRLASKGWKVGTTAEFLQLSPQESAYVEIKLELAQKLRQQRLKRNMSQSQLAKLVRSSQSRVAKMEAADPTVSLDLLVRSLLIAGSTPTEVRKVMPLSGRT